MCVFVCVCVLGSVSSSGWDVQADRGYSIPLQQGRHAAGRPVKNPTGSHWHWERGQVWVRTLGCTNTQSLSRGLMQEPLLWTVFYLSGSYKWILNIPHSQIFFWSTHRIPDLSNTPSTYSSLTLYFGETLFSHKNYDASI